MYATIVDKAGNIYEVHLSSHHKPPGFDSGMLLNASSVWVLYDNKWYPSKAKSQRRTVEDIKSVSSVEELMTLWGVGASEVVSKPIEASYENQ